jgi:hypothetical protein
MDGFVAQEMQPQQPFDSALVLPLVVRVFFRNAVPQRSDVFLFGGFYRAADQRAHLGLRTLAFATAAWQQQDQDEAQQSKGGYRWRGADDLRFFERFEGQDRAALQLIAAKSPVFRVPAGTLLLDVGTRDSWNLYLLSGEIEIVAPDGARYQLTGGSPSARQPVAFLKPRLFSVNALSEVEFLWLYEPMIEAVKRLHPAKFGAPQPDAP